MLQALPLDGKIVCREITAEDTAEEPAPQHQQANRNDRGPRLSLCRYVRHHTRGKSRIHKILPHNSKT
jgi:hypothetical protein